MNAMVRIFSWGERWNVPFREATVKTIKKWRGSGETSLSKIWRPNNFGYAVIVVEKPQTKGLFIWEARWDVCRDGTTYNIFSILFVLKIHFVI
jgi:hypothetical protein